MKPPRLEGVLSLRSPHQWLLVGARAHSPSRSLTRLPDVHPQTHISVFFKNCGIFSHFSWGGLHLSLLPGGHQQGWRHGTNPQGPSCCGRGHWRDARGPPVRAAALSARGPPVRATARLSAPPGGGRPRPCPPRWGRAMPPPAALACPREPPPAGGRSAQRHVSGWRRAAALGEDRWGERQREVRLSARPQPRRGGSPSSPRVCASRSLAGGRHGVQRGGRRRQRRGGGEGEWQEEEAGRPGHGLAHLLQRRHDGGVRGRGARRGPAARRLSGARSRGRRVQGRPRRGEARPGGIPGPRRAGVAMGAAGCESGGRGAALARRALPNTVQRCQPPARHPEPAAEVKYSRDRNAGRGCRARPRPSARPPPPPPFSLHLRPPPGRLSRPPAPRREGAAGRRPREAEVPLGAGVSGRAVPGCVS